MAWPAVFMRGLALAAIRAYQHYLSPHKGYCCAYRQHTGRASCSALGYRVIRCKGLLPGLALLRRRTGLCGIAHRRFHVPVRRLLAAQRGDCDLGCDLPCDLDLPGGRGLSGVCDLASCCDCGSCDWPDRKSRKRRDAERFVHLPPKPGRPRPG